MPAFTPDPANFLQLFALISPLLIAFFLVMLSLFNQDLKGLVYLAGVIMAVLANTILMQVVNDPRPEDAALVCDLFLMNGLERLSSPCPTSVFIAFTIAYIMLPMYFNGTINYAVLMGLFSLFAIDFYTKIISKCTNYLGALLGGLIGFMMGAMWFALFHVFGFDSLLYFNTYSSNRVFCSKPAKQTFKCKVFKGGKLVSETIS